MSEKRDSYTLSDTIEDKDIYKAVLDTRNFEITLFWQRSNYFLVLNSALALGFFSQKPSKLTLLLSALGVMAAFLWYLVMLGSKYWQSRWEDKLAEIERKVAPELKAFAADRTETDAAVKRSLDAGAHEGFQRWLDTKTLKKPSVSFQMTFLSFVFMLGWTCVFVWAISHGAWEAGADSPADVRLPPTERVAATTCAVAPYGAASVPIAYQVVNANPSINIEIGMPEAKPRPVQPKASAPPASHPASNCK